MRQFNLILKFLTAVLIILTYQNLLHAETVAFGYFSNKSDNRGMDYLKQVLPNSFASSLKNKHDVDTIKPGKLSFLNSEDSDYKGRDIQEHELPVISPNIGADYFVYGEYNPLPGNRIKLTIKIYRTFSTQVFSFTEEGKLETEMFKFVDRLSYQIKNIASKTMLFKTTPIVKNSKVGIISNITGEELNILYYSFLKKGYKISSVQGNDLYNQVDDKNIKALYTVSASNAYYNIISDRTSVVLPHGTWSGSKYYKDILTQSDTFNKYAYNFSKTLESFSEKLKKIQPDSFDYFIVIGFDKSKENAWMWCISLKDNRLVVTESGITGGDIEEITGKVINTLSSDLPGKL